MKTDAPSVSTVARFPCDVCGAWLDATHLEPGSHGSTCTFCGAEQAIPHPRTVQPTSDAPSSNPGDALRIAREDRGESLDHVARVTGIREPYLQALEDGGSSFEPYPGRIYGRFFLRQYAEYLGLQSQPLIWAFDRDAEPAVTPEPPRPFEHRPPRPGRWAIGAAVVLVALVVTAALVRRSAAPPVALPPTGPSASPTAVAAVPPAPPDRPSGIRAVAVVTERCWIQAKADGRTVVPGASYLPGKVLHLHAGRTLLLTLGNAGGVRLEVNGERVATGSTGQVAHLSFVWRGGRAIES